MGMYTQIRGWLNVDSIGDYKGERFSKIRDILEKAKADFLISDIDIDRKWVCEDTIAYNGGNGSVYLFFGTELKNYGNPAYEWIKFLIKYFPNSEGRFDFQYEEENWYNDSEGDATSRYLLIRRGEIVEDSNCKTWCYGYGNTIAIKG